MAEENALPKRKDLRIKHYDYSARGAYFVTICTKDRQKLLSHIVTTVGVGALDDPHSSGRKETNVHLTEIGKTVEKYLLSGEKISGVTVDRYVIMPNHLHVIFLLEPSLYAQREDGSSRAPTPTNEMLPHVISTFKRFCNKEIGYNIFQRGYMEHIIRDRQDYEEHLRYIQENPQKWAYDEWYAEET